MSLLSHQKISSFSTQQNLSNRVSPTCFLEKRFLIILGRIYLGIYLHITSSQHQQLIYDFLKPNIEQAGSFINNLHLKKIIKIGQLIQKLQQLMPFFIGNNTVCMGPPLISSAPDSSQNFTPRVRKNLKLLYLRGINVAHHEAYRHSFQLFITVRTNGIYNASIDLFAIMQILIENH
jgi:hypothetical protein